MMGFVFLMLMSSVTWWTSVYKEKQPDRKVQLREAFSRASGDPKYRL